MSRKKKYNYKKSDINVLLIQGNTEREIVNKLGYGGRAAMRAWLIRQGNKRIVLWVDEHEVKLIKKGLIK